MLEEDLQMSLSQLDMEAQAAINFLEEHFQSCYRVSQDLAQQLSELSLHLERDKPEPYNQVGCSHLIAKWYRGRC